MDATRSLASFYDDFKFLAEIKSFLMSRILGYAKGELEWCSETLNKSGVFSKMPNGRDIRLILPRSKEETVTLLSNHRFEMTAGESMATADKFEVTTDEFGVTTDESGVTTADSMAFVGFVGFSRPRDTISKDLIEKLWDADGHLIAEFANQKHLLAYVTAEREIGGNWTNLVVCDSLQGIEEWRRFQFHTNMAHELSPYYYSQIRIHRGLLPDGLNSTKFHVQQTLFLDYGAIPKAPFKITRLCQPWNVPEISEYFQTGSAEELEDKREKISTD